jgi:hypothetical protein
MYSTSTSNFYLKFLVLYISFVEKSNGLKLKFESNSGIEEYLKHVVEQHSGLTQLLTSQVVLKETLGPFIRAKISCGLNKPRLK